MEREIITLHRMGDERLAVWFSDGKARLYAAAELGVSANDVQGAEVADGGEQLSLGPDKLIDADTLYGLGSEAALVEDEKERILGELAQIRRASSFSQTRLGSAAGIRQSVISRIEGCEISPQINTLLKLLAPLGKTLAIVDLGER